MYLIGKPLCTSVQGSENVKHYIAMIEYSLTKQVY